MKKGVLLICLNILLVSSGTYIQADNRNNNESHFGIHLGDLIDDYHNLHSYIRELGNIYVRNEFWGDLYGWKKIKIGSRSVLASKELCEKCCDLRRSSIAPNNPQPKSCDCENGQFYFCSPNSRKGLIEMIPMVADFYENPENILFEWFLSVHTSRYNKRPPKNFPAGAYPYGNEDTYRDYIEYLVEQLDNKVKYWQIGNENDYPKFWAGTPKEYAELLEIASKVIRDNLKDCRIGISFASPDLKGDKNREMWFKAMEHVRSPSLSLPSSPMNPCRTVPPDSIFCLKIFQKCAVIGSLLFLFIP